MPLRSLFAAKDEPIAQNPREVEPGLPFFTRGQEQGRSAARFPTRFDRGTVDRVGVAERSRPR
jgi:hypothetical protein